MFHCKVKSGRSHVKGDPLPSVEWDLGGRVGSLLGADNRAQPSILIIDAATHSDQEKLYIITAAGFKRGRLALLQLLLRGQSYPKEPLNNMFTEPQANH